MGNALTDLLTGNIQGFAENMGDALEHPGRAVVQGPNGPQISLSLLLDSDARNEAAKERAAAQKAAERQADFDGYHKLMQIQDSLLGKNPTLERQQEKMANLNAQLAGTGMAHLMQRRDFAPEIAARNAARDAFVENVGVDQRIANIQTMENLRSAGETRIGHLSSATEARKTNRDRAILQRETTRQRIAAQRQATLDAIAERAKNAKKKAKGGRGQERRDILKSVLGKTLEQAKAAAYTETETPMLNALGQPVIDPQTKKPMTEKKRVKRPLTAADTAAAVTAARGAVRAVMRGGQKKPGRGKGKLTREDFAATVAAERRSGDLVREGVDPEVAAIRASTEQRGVGEVFALPKFTDLPMSDFVKEAAETAKLLEQLAENGEVDVAAETLRLLREAGVEMDETGNVKSPALRQMLADEFRALGM